MTPSLQIHLARPDDADGIAVLSRDLNEYGLPWTWRPERVAHAIAAPETNVAVVREAAGLVAFGIMQYLADDAHLALFAVQPARQRHGMGSALLRWLEESARAAGARRIRVEARRDNPAARNFYNEHGYHELSIVQQMYSGTLDGIRLQKWLRASEGDAV